MELITKDRPIYPNTLVFPVWVFLDTKWHVYNTTEFTYGRRLHQVQITRCGARTMRSHKFDKLGWSFLKRDDICPICKAELIKQLQDRGLLTKDCIIVK